MSAKRVETTGREAAPRVPHLRRFDGWCGANLPVQLRSAPPPFLTASMGTRGAASQPVVTLTLRALAGVKSIKIIISPIITHAI